MVKLIMEPLIYQAQSKKIENYPQRKHDKLVHYLINPSEFSCLQLKTCIFAKISNLIFFQ